MNFHLKKHVYLLLLMKRALILRKLKIHQVIVKSNRSIAFYFLKNIVRSFLLSFSILLSIKLLGAFALSSFLLFQGENIVNYFLTEVLFGIPIIISVAISVSFLLSLYLLLWKIKKNNLLLFYILRNFPFLKLFLLSIGSFTLLLSLANFFLQSEIAPKIYDELQMRIEMAREKNFIAKVRFNKFEYFGNYVIYIPNTKANRELPNNFYCYVYKKEPHSIGFVGRGYLYQSSSGNFTLRSLNGLYLDYYGEIKKTSQNEILSLSEYDKGSNLLSKYLLYFKRNFSFPAFPLTEKTFQQPLILEGKYLILKKIQTFLFVLSPIIFLLYLIFFLKLLPRSYLVQKNLGRLWIPLLWSLLLLILPVFTQIESNFRFTIICYAFFFLLGLLLPLFIKFLPRLELPQSITEKSLYLLKFPKWIRAKTKLYFQVTSKILKLLFYISFAIFCFLFIYRITINWELNFIPQDILLFSIIQLLDLPSNFVNYIVYLLPLGFLFLIYHLHKENILKRLQISSRNYFWILLHAAFVFILIFLGIFFFREKYFLKWSYDSFRMHHVYIHQREPQEIDLYALAENDFIRLSSNEIIFYSKAQRREEGYVLENFFWDTYEDKEQFVSAHEAKLKEDKIILKNPKLLKKVGSQFELIENIETLEIQAPQYLKSLLEVGDRLDYLKTWDLASVLKRNRILERTFDSYYERLFLDRWVPFIIGSILIISILLFAREVIQVIDKKKFLYLCLAVFIIHNIFTMVLIYLP